jgi:hypothetical protein
VIKGVARSFADQLEEIVADETQGVIPLDPHALGVIAAGSGRLTTPFVHEPEIRAA